MKRITYFAAAALLALSVVGATGCMQEQKTTQEADFSGVSKVCELATLKCYYHNVAETDVSDSNPILYNLFRKRVWIEYDGTVTLGINASKLDISKPDTNNVITVTLPQAEIQDIYLDKDSIQDPLTDNGFLSTLSTNERDTMVAKAQDDMEKKARQNTMMLEQANSRAKELVKNYINGIGEAVGQTYTIEWKTA